MVYRLLFNCWYFGYQIDPVVDRLLAKALQSGISDVRDKVSNEHRPFSLFGKEKVVEFNDGTIYQFSNDIDDRFVWLRDGLFILPDGFEYEYRHHRPRVKQMYLFHRAIQRWKKDEVNRVWNHLQSGRALKEEDFV